MPRDYFASNDSTEKSNVLVVRRDLDSCSLSESLCVLVSTKWRRLALAFVHGDGWSWGWFTTARLGLWSSLPAVVVRTRVGASVPHTVDGSGIPPTFGCCGLVNVPPTSTLDFKGWRQPDAVGTPASETTEGGVHHDLMRPINLIAVSSGRPRARSDGGNWYGVKGSRNKTGCWGTTLAARLANSAWARSRSSITASSSVSAKQRRLRMRADTASGRIVRPVPPPLTQDVVRASTMRRPAPDKHRSQHAHKYLNYYNTII